MKHKEYYTKTGKRIRLFNGDCMDFMQGLEANAYDLCIVDPPYGIDFGEFNRTNKDSLGNRYKANKYKNGDWDSGAPNAKYFVELKDKTSNQIIWGGNYFLEKLGSCKGFIFWYKKQPVDNFSDGEFAWTSFDKVARCFEHAYYGNINADKNGRMHPTQKPVKLYRWLLNNYAKENDTILDTHGGSMSLAIACYIEDFELDIIELDEDYYNDAVKRFEQHIRQTTLF